MKGLIGFRLIRRVTILICTVFRWSLLRWTRQMQIGRDDLDV
jgi:hypothetical protein